MRLLEWDGADVAAKKEMSGWRAVGLERMAVKIMLSV
jgi:hypothetical protein